MTQAERRKRNEKKRLTRMEDWIEEAIGDLFTIYAQSQEGQRFISRGLMLLSIKRRRARMRRMERQWKTAIETALATGTLQLKEQNNDTQ